MIIYLLTVVIVIYKSFANEFQYRNKGYMSPACTR